jgi:hypothetical protein
MWSHPIMTTEARREITRWVRWTLIAHTTFVLLMVVAKNVLWEADSQLWKIGKVFRLIELPVLWAVDRTLQVLPLIPPWAAFGSMTVATSVSEIILYSSFGGAFYALVVAIVVYVRERRRTSHGDGEAAVARR